MSGSRNQSTRLPILELHVAGRVERRLQLRPDFVLDLLARGCAHRRLAVEVARRRPVRDVDREDSPDATVAVRRQVVAAPELPLRDRRQRPVRVEIDRVAVGERLIGLEVELDAVHPFRTQLAEPRKRRRGARELRRDEPCITSTGIAAT